MTSYRFIDKLLERTKRLDRGQLEDYLKEIARENIFLRAAVSQLDLGAVILDENSNIIEINSSAEFLLGVSAGRVRGKNITRCPIDLALLKIFEKIGVSAGDGWKQEMYVTFPREQLLRISMSAVRKNPEEEISGWAVSIQDITEFKRVDAQRVQTEKLKALVTMASILAHELGNPLNSLSIHLQLAKRQVTALPEKYKQKISKLINVTNSEVKRLDDIVTRFLQATRPLKPRFYEGDINKILEETLELLLPEIRRNKFTIEKKYGKELPKIYIDHVQIRQAFINIIKNAIEAKSKRAKIHIETLLDNGRIKILFADNGTGIPEDELEKIFEPYYSTKRAGSGLGLAIVNRIIRDHGGTVEVKSKLGEGTTVALYLPIELAGQKLLTQGKK